MANTLGDLSSALILTTALELAVKKIPALRMFTRDFSAEGAKLNQTITTRILGAAAVQNFGSAATDRADTDVDVTLSNHKQVRYDFTSAELSATDRNLVEESAEPMAVAFAKHMMDAIAALWLDANYTNTPTQVATSSVDYSTLTALRKALSERGIRGAKSAAVNADVFDELLNDATIISARQADNGRNAIVEDAMDGVIQNVAGFQGIYEYPDLPDNSENLTGFACARDAAVMAIRPPKDPREVFSNGANFPGNIGIITEPSTGLSVMAIEHIDAATLVATTRLVWIYGVAVGNEDAGQLLQSA